MRGTIICAEKHSNALRNFVYLSFLININRILCKFPFFIDSFPERMNLVCEYADTNQSVHQKFG